MVNIYKVGIRICIVLITLLFVACARKPLPVLETGAQNPMPDAWIDSDTGHRIKKLVMDGGSNRSFYFHNNPFVPGDRTNPDQMIYYRTLENQPPQLYALDLKTGASKKLTNQSRVSGEIVAKKGRKVYYQCRDSVFETTIDQAQTRLVYVFPDSLRGSITTLNADETLLAGAIVSPEERELYRKNPQKRDYFNLIYEAGLERSLFTLSVDSGELNVFYSENAWLNHIQFSPVDPHLLMYCHEGPWHKVDRIWTIDVQQGIPRLMHRRTVDREIAGHEFFSPDGQRIWFDLQIPRSETFYLSSVDVATGEVLRYGLTRNEWSVHF
nr:oligogalacturonate lyase family protein [Prolixibacteraceae bacterium]